MSKTHTKMKAGRLVAVYVEDGQGRRIVLSDERHEGCLERPLLATTQAEARHAVTVLKQLLEELPP